MASEESQEIEDLREEVEQLQKQAEAQLQTLEELAEDFEILSDIQNTSKGCSCDRENQRHEEEVVNVDVPIAGRTNEATETEIIREKETVTEEVPLEGGDDPETMEVERTRTRTPDEAMYGGKPWEDPETMENPGYINVRDIDDDVDVPVAGERRDQDEGDQDEGDE